MTHRLAIRQLARGIRHGQVHAVEMFTGVFAVIWGLCLGAPEFGAYYHASWRALLTLMPAPAWGLVSVLLGLVQLWGLETRDHKSRRAAARSLAAFWSFVGALFIVTDLHITATVVYPSVSSASLWVSWRLGPHKTRRRAVRSDGD